MTIITLKTDNNMITINKTDNMIKTMIKIITTKGMIRITIKKDTTKIMIKDMIKTTIRGMIRTMIKTTLDMINSSIRWEIQLQLKPMTCRRSRTI